VNIGPSVAAPEPAPAPEDALNVIALAFVNACTTTPVLMPGPEIACPTIPAVNKPADSAAAVPLWVVIDASDAPAVNAVMTA
jgi:hypothetical protein